MAIARNRARRRSNRLGGRRTRGTGPRRRDLDTSVIPRALVGAVNGIEVVAVGALRISRDVVLGAVAGAADIGAEALTATTAGVRGVVSAPSRMVGDIAGAAQGTLRETFYDVTHARRGAARALGEMPRVVGDGREATTSRPAVTRRRRRRRTRGLRAVSRPSRPSVAA